MGLLSWLTGSSGDSSESKKSNKSGDGGGLPPEDTVPQGNPPESFQDMRNRHMEEIQSEQHIPQSQLHDEMGAVDLQEVYDQKKHEMTPDEQKEYRDRMGW